MKYFKIILSILFLALMIFSLIYKNILAQEDTISLWAKLADMFFPLFMGYSFLMIILNKIGEKKSKPTEEERETFQKVPHQD